MSLRGQWCAMCAREGHRCPAVAMRERKDGTADYPVCLDCLNDRPCAAARLVGAGRDGSNVQAALDVFGELVFPAGVGTVVTRTPEELGLARVVPSVPVVVRPDIRPDFVPASRMRSGPMREARVKRDVVRVRMIGGEPVRLPAFAVMGAELIGQGSQEQKSEEPPAAKRDEEEITMAKDGQKCAAEGCEHFAYGGREYCTYKHSHKNKAPAKPDALVKRDTKPKAAGGAMRPIDVDPQRPGTAAALIDALGRVDQAKEQVRVALQLSETEVAQIYAQLKPGQREAFMSAGLRAALLSQ